VGSAGVDGVTGAVDLAAVSIAVGGDAGHDENGNDRGNPNRAGSGGGISIGVGGGASIWIAVEAGGDMSFLSRVLCEDNAACRSRFPLVLRKRRAQAAGRRRGPYGVHQRLDAGRNGRPDVQLCHTGDRCRFCDHQCGCRVDRHGYAVLFGPRRMVCGRAVGSRRGQHPDRACQLQTRN
jgi:hypothetical protein